MESALDPSVLESLRQLRVEGGPDVLQEVLGVFLADAPSRLDAIERAVAAGDAATLQRAAHALKGAAAAIGANPLAVACRAVEEVGRTGRIGPEISPLLLALRDEYGRVIAAIEALASQ